MPATNERPAEALAGVGSESDLDYQAYWTTEGGKDWVRAVLAEVTTWARKRLGLTIDTGRDGSVEHGGKRVEVLHRSAGRETGVRVRAWNTVRASTFVVTVIAVDGPSGGWLTVRTASSDRNRRAAKPAVADMILDVVDLADVGPVRTGVRHITDAALDELGALVDDHRRRLPVLVAAPFDGVDFERWLQAVARWTRRCAGIAHVVSLDPNSADRFRTEQGRRAVMPGTLRTYPPGVVLDDPATESAARWISTRTLVGPDDGIERMVERFVRQYQVTHPMPLPAAARDWTRAFERIAAQQLRSAVEPASPSLRERVAARQTARPVEPLVPSSDAEAQTPPQVGQPAPKPDTDALEQLRAEISLAASARDAAVQRLADVQDFLGLPDLQEQTLLELLDAATRSQPDAGAVQRLLTDNDELRAKVEALEDDLEMGRLEAIELALERDRLDVQFAAKNREATFLRSKVAEHDPATAYSWVDDSGPANPLGDCPANWDALLADPRLAAHQLVITGNPRALKAVKPLDLDQAGLRAAWDAFGTMAAYREARLSGDWDSGMHAFCESGPADRFHVPPNKHAHDETSGTRARFGGHRLLPVPTDVDPTGHVHMWAHFKPYSWSAQQKLRIHYYDQVSTDGAVYVGHVGEHLPSGSTEKNRR